MPVYKESTKRSYYVSINYQDDHDKNRNTTKRGFKSSKEAKAWEKEYWKKTDFHLDMTFQSLYELYMEDMEVRIRLSTLESKKHIFKSKILPHFASKPINQIKPHDIRRWQNKLLQSGYKPTYLKCINNQLVALFNYAVRFYNLSENPCHKAGSMGKKNATEMSFFTKDEFNQFIDIIDDPTDYLGYMILYWTGIRIGELLALTPNDIDLENNVISINHSYQRINGEDVITEPKTEKGKRKIKVHSSLINKIQEYLKLHYKIKPSQRIFPFTKYKFEHSMPTYCEKAKLKRIRVHDLRHSHASLLIEQGIQPIVIAKRLGHEKIQTTLDTYGHMYPHKDDEVAELLESMV